jgi:hypothetical protein
MDFIVAYWRLCIVIVTVFVSVGWLVVRWRRESRPENEADTSPPLVGLFWGPSFVRWLDARFGPAEPTNRRRELLLWLVFVVILVAGILLTPKT